MCWGQKYWNDGRLLTYSYFIGLFRLFITLGIAFKATFLLLVAVHWHLTPEWVHSAKSLLPLLSLYLPFSSSVPPFLPVHNPSLSFLCSSIAYSKQFLAKHPPLCSDFCTLICYSSLLMQLQVVCSDSIWGKHLSPERHNICLHGVLGPWTTHAVLKAEIRARPMWPHSKKRNYYISTI